MDWSKELYPENEKPLDRLVDGYSNTSVFRKIAFIGDSLSSGEFETVDAEGKKHYYDLYEYSWGQYIARKNGLTAYNFSRGGMTAKEYMESFAQERDFWNPEKACQAYVIALGANDIVGRGMEIGCLDDIDPENWRNNKPTFLGYYAAIVSRYKEISPDAKFFFVGFPGQPENQHTQRKLQTNEQLRKLTGFFENAWYIDLYTYGPYYDERFDAHFRLHGHLNPSGYILTARLVDSYIDYIVRHNPEDFKTAGFINSGIQYKF